MNTTNTAALSLGNCIYIAESAPANISNIFAVSGSPDEFDANDPIYADTKHLGAGWALDSLHSATEQRFALCMWVVEATGIVYRFVNNIWLSTPYTVRDIHTIDCSRVDKMVRDAGGPLGDRSIANAA